MENTINILAQLEEENYIDILARKAAAGTLRILHAKSACPKIAKLRNDLQNDFVIKDGRNEISETYSDAMDLYVVAYAALHDCIVVMGYTEDDVITVSTKKGEKTMTVFQHACYTVWRYIYDQRAIYDQSPKYVYIEDLQADSNNHPLDREYIRMQKYNGIDRINDYATYTEMLNTLNLTHRQLAIVKYRMRGLSVSAIAKKLQVSHQAISKQLAAVQKEVKAHFPAMVRHFKEARIK